jgi:hypothetical protein
MEAQYTQFHLLWLDLKMCQSRTIACMEPISVVSVSHATLALEQTLKRESDAIVEFDTLAVGGNQHRAMISSISLKRSRSVVQNNCRFMSEEGLAKPSCSFDMDSFLQASKDVQDEILFPSISWPSPGDDDDGDSRDTVEPSPKRRCRGLVRSRNATNLFSLAESARCGSNGSMC